MNIIVRVITGDIQDRDNNSYDNVTKVYVVLAGCSVAVSLALLVVTQLSVNLRHLQWSRKKRIFKGAVLNACKQTFYGADGKRNATVSVICFSSLIALVLGSWCAFFWGVATGNND